jgi:prepilin-type N-terminal cleavage/methylation domain-containing protein
MSRSMKQFSTNRKKGFSLVEMMVTILIFSVVIAGMLQGAVHLGRAFQRTKALVNVRAEIANFSQGINSFSNRSDHVSFLDASNNPVNYVNLTSINGNTSLDLMYYLKDTGNQARLRFLDQSAADPTLRNTIVWYKDNGNTPQILLKEVYRMDTSWNASGVMTAGTYPVFCFPHRDDAYDARSTGIWPKFFKLEFQKLVPGVMDQNKKPLTVPVTLVTQVRTTV